ncbi:MAG: hypothetical protein HYU64_20145 [Armatimonadetes bacterium]|nr:hypothetical protein [Armatimonadota bacterium]
MPKLARLLLIFWIIALMVCPSSAEEKQIGPQDPPPPAAAQVSEIAVTVNDKDGRLQFLRIWEEEGLIQVEYEERGLLPRKGIIPQGNYETLWEKLEPQIWLEENETGTSFSGVTFQVRVARLVDQEYRQHSFEGWDQNGHGWRTIQMILSGAKSYLKAFSDYLVTLEKEGERLRSEGKHLQAAYKYKYIAKLLYSNAYMQPEAAEEYIFKAVEAYFQNGEESLQDAYHTLESMKIFPPLSLCDPEPAPPGGDEAATAEMSRNRYISRLMISTDYQRRAVKLAQFLVGKADQFREILLKKQKLLENGESAPTQKKGKQDGGKTYYLDLADKFDALRKLYGACHVLARELQGKGGPDASQANTFLTRQLESEYLSLQALFKVGAHYKLSSFYLLHFKEKFKKYQLWEDGKKYLKGLIAEFPDSPKQRFLKYLLAELLYDQGDFSQGAGLFRETADPSDEKTFSAEERGTVTFPTEDILKSGAFWEAVCLYRLRQISASSEGLQQIASGDPKGFRGNVARETARAVQTGPEEGVLRFLGAYRWYLHGYGKKTREMLEAFTRDYPGSPLADSAEMLASAACLKLGPLDAAEKAATLQSAARLEELLNRAPDTPWQTYGRCLLGSLFTQLYKSNSVPNREDLLKQALTQFTRVAESSQGDALGFLATMAQAELQALQDDPKKARDTLLGIEKQIPKGDLHMRAIYLLAEHSYEYGETEPAAEEEAFRYWETLLETYPEVKVELGLLQTWAMRYHGAGKKAQFLRLMDRIKKRHPEARPWAERELLRLR